MGGYDRVIPDLAARQHEHTPTKPDVVSYSYSRGYGRMIRIDLMKIRVIYGHEIADQGIVTDHDRLTGRNSDPLVDESALTDAEPSIRSSTYFTSSDPAP
jgi:hypothetical protein